jgi:hypothetical protein
MSSALNFVHRHNEDHTWDSICRNCYLTVATAYDEEDLTTPEHSHDCDELWAAKILTDLKKLGGSENPSHDHYRERH